jgi:hypothetical protein
VFEVVLGLYRKFDDKDVYSVPNDRFIQAVFVDEMITNKIFFLAKCWWTK